MNRQRLILFILVIVFGVAVFWSYTAMPRPKTASTLTYKPGQQAKPAVVTAAAAAASTRETDDGTSLKIALLETEPAPFKGYRRNIFKPVFVDEMKIAKQKAIAIKLPPPPPPKVIVPPVTQVVVPPEAAQLARFTFLGFMKKGSVKTIFLTKDKDILLVKIGDKVAGRYEATDITDQALTLTVTDTGDEIVIPLIENRPLAKGP
ncbi:MAG: hypothetical protein WCI45_05555 [Desulfuromonadales bacterium]